MEKIRDVFKSGGQESPEATPGFPVSLFLNQDSSYHRVSPSKVLSYFCFSAVVSQGNSEGLQNPSHVYLKDEGEEVLFCFVFSYRFGKEQLCCILCH